MDLPGDYETMLRLPPPSILLGLVGARTDPPGPDAVRTAIEAAGVEVSEIREPRGRVSPSSLWELGFELRWPDEESRFVSIWVEPAPRSLLDPLLEGRLGGRGLGDEVRGEARGARFAMGVAAGFDAHPLLDFHRQLSLVHAITPGVALLVDTDALELRSPAWLMETATAEVPPSPRTLYSVHAVAGDDGPGHAEDTPIWLHTHGLLRCGCIELDMVDVPRSASTLCADLLHTVAAMFLEWGVPPPDEPFLAGQGLELVWLPWDDAMDRLGRSVVGDRTDRQGDEHGGVRGVLFAPRQGLLRRRYLSPAVYQSVLEDNPLLYVSNLETERMAMLARERLPRFLRLVDRFAGTEGWRFLVKLGYPVDGAEDDNEREHLWFEVHAVDGAEVDATLLNEPYSVAQLHEGQRAHHRLSLLTDWSILSPEAQFDAESIEALERRVGPAAN